MSATHSAIRVMFRADDTGAFRSANRAARECFEHGIIRNIGVMACCPWVEDAYEQFGRLKGLCVGMHATVSGEWSTHRWTPVLPPEQVPSLVDERGLFPPNPVTQWEQRRPSNDEIIAELSAQLARLRKVGFHVEYMDTHMGFEWYYGLADRMMDLCRREGLAWHAKAARPGLPRVEGGFSDPVEHLMASLKALKPGVYAHFCHPMCDDEEARSISGGDSKRGHVAIARDLDRKLMLDPRLSQCIRECGIESIQYSEFT